MQLLNPHLQRINELSEGVKKLHVNAKDMDAKIERHSSSLAEIDAKIARNERAKEVGCPLFKQTMKMADIVQNERTRLFQALQSEVHATTEPVTPQSRVASSTTIDDEETIQVSNKRTSTASALATRERSREDTFTPSRAKAKEVAGGQSPEYKILHTYYSNIVCRRGEKVWYAVSCAICGANASVKWETDERSFFTGIRGLRQHVATKHKPEGPAQCIDTDPAIKWTRVSEDDVKRIERDERPRVAIRMVMAKAGAPVARKTASPLRPATSPASPRSSTVAGKHETPVRATLKRPATEEHQDTAHCTPHSAKKTKMPGGHSVNEDSSDEMPLSQLRGCGN